MSVALPMAPEEEPEDFGDPEDRPEADPDIHVRGDPKVRRLIPWLKMRHMLGASRDRRRWLQFYCAVTNYHPYKWQIRAHLHNSGAEPDVRTNKLVTAGIRTGKTRWLLSEHEQLHLFLPGHDHIMLAPTYDQVREVLLREWLADVEEMASRGYPLLKHMNWSLMRADLVCGARVFFRSGQKIENSRGFKFATAADDEADYQRGPMVVLNTVMGRLSALSYIRQATVTTTPYEYAGSTIQFFAQQREAAELLPPAERALQKRSWWYIRARTLDNPALTPDFIRSLHTLSKTDWLREVEGCPIIHRQARVMSCYDPGRHLYGRVTGKAFQFDKRRPYDLGIDWGQHRPSYFWYQPVSPTLSVLFHEYHPEDESEETQLEYVRQVALELGADPELAGVDKHNLDQIARLERMFPRCNVLVDETTEQQSRKSSVSAWHALLDPKFGPPRLLIADHLAGSNASKRGVVAMMLNIPWEWDGKYGRYLDVAEKEGFFEHAFDAGAYWAKNIGVRERRPSLQAHTIVRGMSPQDEMLAALGIRNRR